MTLFPVKNIRTTKSYVAVHCEDASFSIFRDFPNRSFCRGEVCDGSGGMNAIVSRPEVTDDVMSGIDVDTFRYYARVNLLVKAIFPG